MSELGPFDPARVGATLTCTCDPVPGLAGVVHLRGEPAAGVRVRLQQAVASDTELEANGYRLRVWPEILDEAVSDAEGRFLLTPKAPGSYYVRAEPATGAPAEVGPLEVDERLGGPPLVLPLGAGGAIEGRVQLARNVDPEGAIVGITRGDGGERTQRVASDGRFRFDALVPGPWRVELRSAEVFGPPSGYSSTQSPGVKPFDLAANCTVHEGETTYLDVSDAEPESLAFEGRLLIDERPGVGWSAHLGPPGRLDFEGQGWTALDSDGRFELRAREPGRYRLTLRQQGGEFQEQFLFEDVHLRGGDAPWERELHTGKLLLAGLDGWKGDGVPRAVHVWRGPGQLFSIAVPVGDGTHAIDVPAGPAELRAPNESLDLESWKFLRTIEVPRGGTLRLELTRSELDRP